MNQASEVIGRRAVAWDPAQGVLTVGERSVTLTCAPGDNECILRTYLHLVADQRDVALDRAVVLRRDDVLVLAEVLDLDDVRLEQQLGAILQLSGEEAKALRRDLLRHRVTAAAMGVGLIASLPLAQAAAADGRPPAPAGPAATVLEVVTSPDSIDRALDIELPPVAATPAPAEAPPAPPVATDPPVAAAAAPEPATPAEDPAPAPEPEVAPEIGWSVTYERDPDFVPPEGVEIGDAMVLERDLPAPPEGS